MWTTTKSAAVVALLALGITAGPVSAGRQIHKWKDADGVIHFSDTPPPPGATVLEAPAAEDPESPPGGENTQRGLTWGVLEQEGLPAGTVDLHCHGGPKVDQRYAHRGSCNPYHGDTSCAVRLPVLCFKSDGTPPPPGVPVKDFYHGWSGGQAALTLPTAGAALTSAERGDAMCSTALGTGWRMAEFHDGGGGWGFVAQGRVASALRFWVRINDQPGNCWNSRAANERVAPATVPAQPRAPAAVAPSQAIARDADEVVATPGA